jgi:formylglycine-generating enzyme required for sulfatase activity
MKLLCHITLTLILATLVGTGAGFADTWALLVGIDDYQDPRISDLSYTVNDVIELHKALTDPKIGAIPKSQVYLMTNRSTGEDLPTHTNVLFRLENLARRVQPEDTFIFHFSGHGMVRGGEQYLLSINSDPRSLTTLASTAIPLERLQQLLKQIRAHQVMLFLDACRNDPETGKGNVDNLLTDALARAFRIEPRRQAGGRIGGSATFYACSLGERAFEWHEKQHGVFSFYLVEGLRGKAANARNQVTLRNLAAHVIKQTQAWSQEHKPPNIHQTPWLVSEGAADMVLATLPEKVVVEELSSLATVEVHSTPPGATVYIDGVQHGRTPATIHIDTGVSGQKTVIVALELEGYVTKRGRVNLRAGHQVPWNAQLDQLPELPLLPERIQGKDDTPMALIPAGEFPMGSDTGEPDEKPRRLIDLNAFYIELYEVTNAHYREFIVATGHRAPQHGWNPQFNIWHDIDFPTELADHPVVNVGWEDAKAYCEWVDKRLPTKAEWEKAARGQQGWKFPWGNTFDAKRCNTHESELRRTLPVYSLADGGSFYGLNHAAGNVAEWTNDVTAEGLPIFRGGSFKTSQSLARCASRRWTSADARWEWLGFR